MFCFGGDNLNYYESKADLLGDTIESIWREIFFNPEDEQAFNDVAACISWIYKRLEYGNEQFPGFFSLHSLGFIVIVDCPRRNRTSRCNSSYAYSSPSVFFD